MRGNKTVSWELEDGTIKSLTFLCSEREAVCQIQVRIDFDEIDDIEKKYYISEE